MAVPESVGRVRRCHEGLFDSRFKNRCRQLSFLKMARNAPCLLIHGIVLEWKSSWIVPEKMDQGVIYLLVKYE